jgi:hypothetical protein
MSPFPETVPIRERILVATAKHQEAQWPLFVYDLNS